MAEGSCFEFYSPSSLLQDEDLALELMEELSFDSPHAEIYHGMVTEDADHQRTGNQDPLNFNQHQSFCIEQKSNCTTESDAELARILQNDEDKKSMFDSAAIERMTEMELLRILQKDEDESGLISLANEDQNTDAKLATALQAEEDMAANDLLIAQQLQEEEESEQREKSSHRIHHRSVPGPSVSHSAGAIHHDLQSDHRLLALFQPPIREHLRVGADMEDVNHNDFDDSYEGLLNLAEANGESHQQGLNQEELNALPTTKFKRGSRSAAETSDADSSNCHVCLCDFAENAAIRSLPCLHRFHRDCIDKWIKINAICPVCRIVIKDQIYQPMAN